MQPFLMFLYYKLSWKLSFNLKKQLCINLFIGFVISDLRPRIPIMPLGTVTVTSLCLVTSTEPPPKQLFLSIYLDILSFWPCISPGTVSEITRKRKERKNEIRRVGPPSTVVGDCVRPPVLFISTTFVFPFVK